MLSLFDPLRDLSLLSVSARMLLAVLCGGVIGIEREYKRRPAGFRTHILICLGSSMTTLTSQYLMLVMHYATDIGRLGAQVIAGVGFIVAGAIIVTRRRRVKGLTTAAGLWTAAIVGLACGAGFYEGAILVTGLILVAELAFTKLEYHVRDHTRETNLYIEYTGNLTLDAIIAHFREIQAKITDMEMTRTQDGDHSACVIFTVQLKHQKACEQLLTELMEMNGVKTVEEL